MAEKEYIEREKAMEALMNLSIRIATIEENRDMFYHDSGWNGASVGARVAVKAIPAADVVEVVRCEKCKHYLEPYCVRGVKERYGLVYVERTDFCSRGERREDVEV